MATDPKWAALRKWLQAEGLKWGTLGIKNMSHACAGRAAQCDRVLAEMSRIARQRPKTGAKQR